MRNLGIAGLGLLLVACAANPNTIAAHVVKVGKVDDLVINDLRSAKVNNCLTIQATLANASSSIQQLYYRCKFVDGNKFQVGEGGQWVPVRVYGKSSVDISCVATEPTAIDFKLELSTTGTGQSVFHSN